MNNSITSHKICGYYYQYPSPYMNQYESRISDVEEELLFDNEYQFINVKGVPSLSRTVVEYNGSDSLEVECDVHVLLHPRHPVVLYDKQDELKQMAKTMPDVFWWTVELPIVETITRKDIERLKQKFNGK